MKYLSFFVIAAITVSCSKKIANYKVVNGGYVIWRYTNKNQVAKVILSTGDTLCHENIGYSLFIISKKTKDTSWILKPVNNKK